MFHASRAIAAKDIRLLLRSGAGFPQALLLGLLLIFVFSLSREASSVVSPRSAATIFWLATAFCLVLCGNMCHGLEESSGGRNGLLLIPAPLQSIWLGKAMAMLLMLGVAQSLFVPAICVFLQQSPGPLWPQALGSIVCIDIGLVALGSLLGALAQGQAARESLLSVVLFPLIIPVLLAGIHIVAAALDPAPGPVEGRWFVLIIAFTALFVAVSLVIFPFAYLGED